MIRQWIGIGVAAIAVPYVLRQVRKPDRWFGRLFAWSMNRSHSGLTGWGLAHVTIGSGFTILDVGCGGARRSGSWRQSRARDTSPGSTTRPAASPRPAPRTRR